MSTSSGQAGRHDGESEPVERIIDRRRAEGEDGHVAGEPDSSYTDNPGFAGHTGRAVDVSSGELDYVEEPGVGGVSSDGSRYAAEDPDGT